jgi:hypothetical protein
VLLCCTTSCCSCYNLSSRCHCCCLNPWIPAHPALQFPDRAGAPAALVTVPACPPRVSTTSLVHQGTVWDPGWPGIALGPVAEARVCSWSSTSLRSLLHTMVRTHLSGYAHSEILRYGCNTARLAQACLDRSATRLLMCTFGRPS